MPPHADAQPTAPVCARLQRVRPLEAGKLDIVGDVHGEHDALQGLLQLLGYADDGSHRDGRSLVFVGDLVDRGPDSVGVVARVRALVDAGRAQVVLGNHELNLLRGQRKHGNDWFWDEGAASDAVFTPCVKATGAQRHSMLAWFETLPLALWRGDLRVVHAAWDSASLSRLALAGGRIVELFERWDGDVERGLDADGWLARAAEQRAAHRHHFGDAAYAMPMLDAVGHCDARRQTGNPIRVATSGIERCAPAPFFSSGQWRFARRVPWWNAYRDRVPVVVGHFWRHYVALRRQDFGKGDADLFDGVAPTAWMGPARKVFCVDYSVGGRYQERRSGATSRTRLGALRWPERELVLDTGERVATTA